VSVIHLIAYNFPVERLWIAKQHFFQDVHVLLLTYFPSLLWKQHYDNVVFYNVVLIHHQHNYLLILLSDH
jgi:hypothetical protein